MRRLLGFGVYLAVLALATVGSEVRSVAVAPPAPSAVVLERQSAVELDRAPLFVPLAVDAALEPIRADVWQAAGFTGNQRSVAIVDSGFAGYLDALGSSLPDEVVARSFRLDSDVNAGTDHGLRAAEIVHDVAPNAALYLVNFSTEAELSAAVDFLIAEDVDVVSFSLGFIHSGPGDGTGVINAIVSRAVDAGIAWSVASGNWAEQHWSGVFADTDGNSIHEFVPDEQLNGRAFRAGDLVIASLRWEGTWGAACDDYDLELFGPDGALVAASRDIQSCSGDPVESVELLATQAGTYSARVVEARSDAPRMLSLLVLGIPDRGDVLDLPVAARSLSQPADHSGVLSVGALLNDSLTEAAFSSRGPTADGRSKPDLLSPTGLVNSAGETFSGTSAAAPHAAGMLALLSEAFPTLSANQLIAELRARGEAIAASTTRAASLGSLVGLGELLPVGGDEAEFVGEIPTTGGSALLRYRGPDGYPLRFSHLLTGLLEADAYFRLDVEAQRWNTFIRGAPDFVQDLERLDDGDLVIGLFPAAN